VAPIPTHSPNKSYGWKDRRFFEVNQGVTDPKAAFELELRHRVAMIKQGDVWRFTTPPDTHLAFVYFSIPYSPGIAGGNASSCPQVDVEYEGTLIPVKQLQQIYDSDHHLLIDFTNNCSVSAF